MRQHCRLLVTLASKYDEHGADQEILQAAIKVRRYFNLAAPHHHADEEQDLFPLLRPDAQLQTLMTELGREHGQLEASWSEIDVWLQRLSDRQPGPGLLEQVEVFERRYLRHIDLEDTHLIPAARRSLSEDQLRGMAQRMAAKRGVAID